MLFWHDRVGGKQEHGMMRILYEYRDTLIFIDSQICVIIIMFCTYKINNLAIVNFNTNECLIMLAMATILVCWSKKVENMFAQIVKILTKNVLEMFIFKVKLLII